MLKNVRLYISKKIEEEIVQFKENKIFALTKWITWTTFIIFICTLQLFTSMKGMSNIPIYFTIALGLECAFCLFLKKQITINIAMFMLLFYLIYAIIITLIGTRVFYPYMRTTINIVLMAFVVYFFTTIFKSAKKMILIFIISSIVLAIVFTYFYRNNIFSFEEVSEERIGGKFGNLNDVGFSFAISILFIFIYITYYKPKVLHIIILLLLSLPFMFLLTKTGSRGAFLIALISYLYLFFKLLWNKHKFILFLSLLFFAIFIVIIFFIPAFSVLSNRIRQLFELFLAGSSSDASVNIRFMMQVSAYELWLRNILFGYGFDAFAKYESFGVYSHATLCEILVNFGLIGFFLFFSPFIICLIYGQKKTLSIHLIIAIIICVIIPEFFVGILIYQKLFFVLFGFVAGVFQIDNSARDPSASVSFDKNKRMFLSFRFNKGFLSHEKK